MLRMSSISPLLTSNSIAYRTASSADCAFQVPYIQPNTINFSYNIPRDVIKGAWRSKKWKLQSTAEIENTMLLNEEDNEKWDACREALTIFNFTTEEKDKILGKAFGHIHSPYWTEERKKEVPNYTAVTEILNFLRSLNLTDDDICKLLKKFPEVLGCSIDDEVKNNVQQLEKVWGIEGKTLRNLLLRNPKVLGYNVDCKGDCIAQCTRCWVRF